MSQPITQVNDSLIGMGMTMAGDYSGIQKKILYKKSLRDQILKIESLFLTAQQCLWESRQIFNQINEEISHYVQNAEDVRGES